LILQAFSLPLLYRYSAAKLGLGVLVMAFVAPSSRLQMLPSKAGDGNGTDAMALMTAGPLLISVIASRVHYRTEFSEVHEYFSHSACSTQCEDWYHIFLSTHLYR